MIAGSSVPPAGVPWRMPRAALVHSILSAVLIVAGVLVGGAMGPGALRGRTLAQNASPEVTTLGGAIDLRGAVDRASEHGCSQSFASSDEHTALRLIVDARGAATLTAEGERHETSGPSPGRYAAGDHELTRVNELSRAVLTGRATRTPAGIEVRFDQLETSSVRFTGYGSLPLPPATRVAIATTLRCALVRTDVLPGTPTPDEHAQSLSLLACEITDAPPPLDRLEVPTLHFGHGAGVRTVSEERMWDHRPTRAVRLADR